jgi:hypothetical protein
LESNAAPRQTQWRLEGPVVFSCTDVPSTKNHQCCHKAW